MSTSKTPVLDHLLAAGKPIWEKYCDHPFVDGIGSGNLDKERFQFYMIQDYLYLLQYTKVFAMGIVKTDSERIMQFFALSVDAFLNGELDTHRAYMKRLGINAEEAENTPTALANSTYTSYMLNVAQIYG
ncbi:MAG TPA: thiaminase II, partial [Clostridiaceae bacterium]|nr:thiaminase II [Clostridiaceae bacterium]